MTPTIKRAYSAAMAAKEHSDFSHRVGAVIFDKSGILSIGFNKRKTHPLQRKFQTHEEKLFLHAEISALVKGSFDGKNMIIVRGNNLDSKPCLGCMAAIIDAGIKKIYYFIDGSLIEEVLR